MQNHKALEGLKTRTLSGSQLPVWTLGEKAKAGTYLDGVYQGIQKFPTQDGKTANGHVFLLKSGDAEFVLAKKAMVPAVGDRVSCSGKAFDDSLSNDLIGSRIIAIFEGYAEKKVATRAAMKLFRIEVVEAETAAA